jgi:hypothetical protein
MLELSGRLDRRQFLSASALRIGMFLASVVGFPSLWIAAAPFLGCSGRPESASAWWSACFRISFAAAIWFKPLALSLFLLSLVGVSVRRARDAGTPACIGLLIPLLFAADHAFFDYFWIPWVPRISPMAWKIMFPPQFALLALGCVATLCVLPSHEERHDSYKRFGLGGLVASGLGLAIAAAALFRALDYLVSMWAVYHPSGAEQFLRPMNLLMTPAFEFVPYAMVALAVLLAWFAWHACRKARLRNEAQSS